MCDQDEQLQSGSQNTPDAAAVQPPPRYTHMAESEPGYGDDCEDPRWIAQTFADEGLRIDPRADVPDYLVPFAEDAIDCRLEKATTHRANWVRAAVALATSAGIHDAAKQSGLCVRTLQRLQRKPEFLELLRDAQQRAIRHAIDSQRPIPETAISHLNRLMGSADERVALRAIQTLAAVGHRAVGSRSAR